VEIFFGYLYDDGRILILIIIIHQDDELLEDVDEVYTDIDLKYLY